MAVSYDSDTIKERLDGELSSLPWTELKKELELSKKQAIEHHIGEQHIGHQKFCNERAQKLFIPLAQFAKDTIGHSKFKQLVLETCGESIIEALAGD